MFALLSTTPVYAQPNFYGGIEASTTSEKDKDLTFNIDDAYVGLNGLNESELFDVAYSLEGHLSKDKTGQGVDGLDDAQESQFRLREALVVLKKEGIGNIVFGNGKTGVYRDIYSHVDLFSKNNMSNKSRVTLFHPTYWGTQTISIGSDSFGGFSGNLVATTSNSAKDEGEHFDVYHLRLKYQQDDFYLGLNRQEVTHEMTPQTEDTVIYTSVASYKANNFTVSGLIEKNINSTDLVNGQFEDSTVFGVTGSYNISDFVFNLGAQTKQYENNLDSESIYQASLHYKASSNIELYTEIAVIDANSVSHNPVIDTDSNFSIGLITHF